jgi:Fic family protein
VTDYPVTPEDMRERIRESNLIEGITDPREVEQSLKAWELLMEQPCLDHDVIREVQRIVTANQRNLRDDQRGAYRDVSHTNVRVGSYRPPTWDKVAALMHYWVRDLDNRSPWINHVIYESVHPFADGNGRTGRLFMWRQQVREGEQPRLFRAANRFDYYDELERGRRRQSAAEGVELGDDEPPLDPHALLRLWHAGRRMAEEGDRG